MSAIKRVSTVLVRARAKIADPEQWCQNALARDEHGHPTSAKSTTAVKWCALGAIRSLKNLAYPAGYDAQDYLGRALGGDVATINDYKTRATTHPRILAGYDKAIRAAKREERAK